MLVTIHVANKFEMLVTDIRREITPQKVGNKNFQIVTIIKLPYRIYRCNLASTASPIIVMDISDRCWRCYF